MPGITVEVRQSSFWMTNASIITTDGGEVVLVDPGVLPDELAGIAERAGEGRIVAAISTHEDWDHVLWSRDFPADVPRLAHPGIVRILEDDRDGFLRSLATWEADLGVTWDRDLVGRLQPVTGESVTLGGVEITIVPTPGHTPGHTSLWLADGGILFAGDMLSDIDIPMLALAAGVGETYLRSLGTLEPLLATATMVIPGHGTPCDRVEARRRLDADRAYIESLRGWSRDNGDKLPVLETFMPGDIRANRPDNEVAHRQNATIPGT